MQSSSSPLPSSYRDPSGFVFQENGMIYRQVNKVYRLHYDHFITSGCYDHLVRKGMLLPHKELEENLTGSADHYCTLLPEQLAFISYPYEWCFDMFRDAALLTLRMAKEVLEFGLVLKDATPFNIQFHQGRPIFIDTLSFEKYDETQPWIAYRQFCQSFLAPLVLMHYSNSSLQPFLLAYPEGIPLTVARKLLPWKSRWNLHTYLHVHLQAKLSEKPPDTKKNARFSKTKFLNILRSLEQSVTSARLKNTTSTWSEYYTEASQREGYLSIKKKIVEAWMAQLPFNTAVDLGANEGEFSLVLAKKAKRVLAVDFDPNAVNKLYHRCNNEKLLNLQPLVIDLSLPSPAIGVNNEERQSFLQRGKSDLALALALIHHLAIGKNIPFNLAAKQLSLLGDWLIIEFVPKNDEKVRYMLEQKPDIYPDYSEQHFESAFINYFDIKKKEEIGGSGRVLYLMEKK